LDDDQLVADLAEANQEISMGGRGMNLVAELGEGGAGGFHPFRRGEGQQGRLVSRADEFEFVGHGSLFEFEGQRDGRFGFARLARICSWSSVSNIPKIRLLVWPASIV